MATTSTNVTDIDLKALEAEIAQLSPEEIQKQLVDLRTKQRVNQSKHQGSAAQKAYMKRRAEMNKILAAKAKELGIYDSILATAKENAAKIIAEREADEADAEETADEAK